METNTLTKKKRDKLSISDILKRLTLGNDRFIGREERISRDHRKQIEETALGQFPCAVVLSCIDSMDGSSAQVNRSFTNKNYGFSVRCVRD